MGGANSDVSPSGKLRLPPVTARVHRWGNLPTSLCTLSFLAPDFCLRRGVILAVEPRPSMDALDRLGVRTR